MGQEKEEGKAASIVRYCGYKKGGEPKTKFTDFETKRTITQPAIQGRIAFLINQGLPSDRSCTFQDSRYGKGMRVHTINTKRQHICTVCGAIR